MLSATLLVAACGGSASTAAPASGAPAPTSAASAGGPATGPSAQFGGDICSALTQAEIEAAAYPQGPAAFDSTDTQKDAATGQAVVCQYLVKFGDAPSIVGVVVSLLDDAAWGERAAASMIAPPEAVSGIGSEAFLVTPAPGLFGVYVSGSHGKFKLGTQAKDTAIALATIAVARD